MITIKNMIDKFVKLDLVNELYREAKNLKKEEAEKIVDIFNDIITKQVKLRKIVKIADLLYIQLVDTKAKKGCNPRTGEIIDVPARKKIKVKICQSNTIKKLTSEKI